jgi:hypothetical protein
VGLWKADGTLLASVTVPSQSTALLSGGYRWVDVSTSVSLIAGQNYVVGALYTAGQTGDYFGTDPAISPQFTYLGSLFDDAPNGLIKPTTGFNQNGWFGANVQVPDGGVTSMLLGMGMLGLGFVRRMVKA